MDGWQVSDEVTAWARCLLQILEKKLDDLEPMEINHPAFVDGGDTPAHTDRERLVCHMLKFAF